MKADFFYSIDTIKEVLNPNSFRDWEKNLFFANITTSSMEVDNASLFVPLKGTRDGHEFIPDALEKGAPFFLCKKNHNILKRLSPSQKEKAILVDDPLKALGELAHFHRSRFKPLVIAITGSSGKTTTKELLGQCLSSIGGENLVITEKNYNNEIGLPFTLFKLNDRTRIAVLELGMNHLGEIERLSKMSEPAIAIVTNVGSAHIEHLGSLQKVATAKSEILSGMKNNGFLFLNSTTNFLNIFIKKAKRNKIKIQQVSLKDKTILQILQKNETGFDLKIFEEKVNWKILGKRNLENLNLVLHVLKEIRFPKKEATRSIENFKNPDKRFILEHNYFQVINDTYNANPESMQSSLDSARQMAGKEKIYAVLGDMKELGKFSKKYHLETGKFCALQKINGLITFGRDSKFISNEFQKQNNFDFCKHFQENENAIEKIIEYIKENIPKNSIILIKGSRSMKMERITSALSVLNF